LNGTRFILLRTYKENEVSWIPAIEKIHLLKKERVLQYYVSEFGIVYIYILLRRALWSLGSISKDDRRFAKPVP